MLNKKLTAIVEAHVARRLKNLDKEINDLVDEYVHERLEQMMNVVFGVRNDFGRLEAVREFNTHPIGAMLTSAAKKRASSLVDKIIDDESLVTEKMIRGWRTVYRDYYRRELDDQVRKLMYERGERDAQDDAEDAFKKSLKEALGDG